MLFDGDGNRMTPSHALNMGTRYRYYVSGSLITKDRTQTSAGLRIPAAEIEQLVSSRVHRWLRCPLRVQRHHKFSVGRADGTPVRVRDGREAD
jgi:site-specific DNA recombinase